MNQNEIINLIKELVKISNELKKKVAAFNYLNKGFNLYPEFLFPEISFESFDNNANHLGEIRIRSSFHFMGQKYGQLFAFHTTEVAAMRYPVNCILEHIFREMDDTIINKMKEIRKMVMDLDITNKLA